MRSLPCRPPRKEHDAEAFICHNKNPSAFASNNFGETKRACSFVRKLSKAGATNITVKNVMPEPEAGGPYADTLVVTVPDRKASRLLPLLLESHVDAVRAKRVPGGMRFSLWWD